MEQKAERLVKDDRTHYLQQTDGCDFVWPCITLIGTQTTLHVTRWHDVLGLINLDLRNASFTLFEGLRAEEARLLGQALLMAADDAEKAIDAAYVQDEVTA